MYEVALISNAAAYSIAEDSGPGHRLSPCYSYNSEGVKKRMEAAEMPAEQKQLLHGDMWLAGFSGTDHQ